MNRADSDEPSERSGWDDEPDAGTPGQDPAETGQDFAHESEYAEYGEYDEYDDYERYAEQHEEEVLRRQLAHFAFVREEYDREVRLTLRDVPVWEIARTFHNLGAPLISVTGERAMSPPVAAAHSAGGTNLEIAPEERKALRGRRRRHRGAAGPEGDDMSLPQFRPHRHTGELTMRYFFGLREIVYTVNIVSSTGIVDSIADTYPSAAQCEHELTSRLEVLFRAAGG